MTMFRRTGDLCVATFSRDEARVLRQCMAELAALLHEGRDRTDPVQSRLFPDAYPASSGESADFRRLTEADLTTAKLGQAKGVLEDLLEMGDQVRLDDEAAERWLRALTDVRLALGIRLGVQDDTNIESELDEAVLADPVSPRVGQILIYTFLGLLQESLVDALSG
jgi:Domain of unknown function (DUF2017)